METQTLTPGTGITDVLPQDSYPYVVTRVSKSGKTAWMKPLEIVDLTTGHEPARFDGPFPVWSHAYTEQERAEMVREDAPEIQIRLNNKGRWVRTNYNLRIGEARYHRNYSY